MFVCKKDIRNKELIGCYAKIMKNYLIFNHYLNKGTNMNRIKEVKALENYQILVTFDNGEKE